MLPSTGYFKTINCPFFESGFCERPYCHFRHVKRDPSASSSTAKDGVVNESVTKQQMQEVALIDVDLEIEDVMTTSAQLTAPEPDLGVNTSSALPIAVPKATYNPTPIAELNKMYSASVEEDDDDPELRKKHIPVPYTPRKPITLPVKRPHDINGSSKPFIYNPPAAKYTPGCPDAAAAEVDLYTPKGSTESQHKYTPGTETQLQEYTPKTNETQNAGKHNYVPSDKAVNKKKVLEYKPMKVVAKPDGPTYKPTPKALVPCFSSDEEEPDTKKQKFENDLNGMDDFESEFDILGEILKEEIPQLESNDQNKDPKQIKTSEIIEQKEASKKSSNRLNDSKSKSSTDKHDSKKSHERDKSGKSEKKEKSSSSNNRSEKSESKAKDVNKESSKKSHKSSSKDKHREEKKHKSTDSKKSSSSKSSEKSSKHSENGSMKTSEKHSRHSSSSHSRSSSKDKKKTDHHRSSKGSKNSKEKKKRKEKESDSRHLSNESNDFDNDVLTQDDDLAELSDPDEDAIALECKKIFDEYVPTEKPLTDVEDLNTSNKLEEESIEEYIPVKKRISHTSDKNVKVIPRAPLKPDYKVSAAQTMASRLEKIKDFHAARNTTPAPSNNIQPMKQELPKPTASTPNISSKIRIAHVPYASTLLNAKRTIPPCTKPKPEEPSTSSTIVQTIKKGAQRVAHIPNDKFIDRPGVLEALASKIPANIRSTYLNMMIDVCIKIYLSPTDAYARAQHEELATSKKCSTVQIYKNSAVLTISRLKKEFLECNGIKKDGSDCSTLKSIPQGSVGDSSGSWSIVNKNRRSSDTSLQLVGAKFYNNIKKWILTEEQLVENGFPRPHPSGNKGRAIIYGQNKAPPPKGLIRTCCRCKKEYNVDKKGFPVIAEDCIYHPKNKYRVRGEVKYQCCSQDNSSDGCCIASCHVYEYVDYDNLKGYIQTMPPTTKMDDYGIYSLDCEMCYTTQGLDLTRITVINSACKVVYETLIKPLHPIIDYNTRYSGITEEQMASVKTTLLEVQATLLAMFNNKTILVGHSLESDFKALKLIHDTVIDTSVLFPHKMGPPFKRALRNLSSEYLRKIIQNAVEGGHDSAEDATVCMELLIYKLKEDLKTR